METLHVTHKVLHVENKEVEIIAKLQKASKRSHTTGVLLLMQGIYIFVF